MNDVHLRASVMRPARHAEEESGGELARRTRTMDDETRTLLGDYETTKPAHLPLFSGIEGLDLATE